MNINVPMTKFELIDQSGVTDLKTSSPTVPLILTAFASSKGPEDMRVVVGKQFYNLYGSEISFNKYGQPLLQAARIIDSNGVLLAKRVVAPDAKLANIGIMGVVTKKTVQKEDADGNPLYLDEDTGLETINSTGNVTPIMNDICELKFISKTVPGVDNIDQVYNNLNLEYDIDSTPGKFIYPLFVLTDIGRGVSLKKFRIAPNYTDSKYLGYTKYILNVVENDSTIETLNFTFDPDVIENNENMSIENVCKLHSEQLKCKQFEGYMAEFIAKIAELSSNDETYCYANDVLFGKDKKTLADITDVVVNLTDGDAINLSYIYGLNLQSGDNGSFGNKPVTTAAYENQLVDFFNGTFTDDIYDLDKHKIDLCIDANYPQSVKRQIESLSVFREDLQYIRDMGLGLKSMDQILKADLNNSNDTFSNTFHVSYDVIDPYTKKQIPVTICYTLAKLLIDHFKNGRNRPLAGQLNKMVIDEAIPGTVNFIPKITPSYNQKDQLIDARINYVGYYDDILTIETCYTSQEDLTQLSFTNNMLAAQEVVKAVRTKCPKIRYSFTDGDDLQKYKDEVEAVLNKYTGNFKSLKMVYLQDDAMKQNKVFYAAIEVVFRDFVQSEYFKLYALNG